MLWALILLLIFLSTFGLLSLYKIKFNLSERIALSVVLGSSLFTAVTFILSSFLGLTTQTILLSISILLIAFIHACFTKLRDIRSHFPAFSLTRVFKEHLHLLILLPFFFFLFSKIFLQQFIWEKGDLYAGWIGSWSDGAYHLTLINSFVFSDNFPPKQPVYTGFKLDYPFLADFFSSILIKTGASINTSTAIPAILLLTSSVILIYSISYKVTGSKFAAFLSVFIGFFTGGLGFLEFFSDLSKNGFSLSLMTFPPKEYTHLEAQNIKLINFISGALIPQRSFLFGLPLVATIYLLIKKGLENLEWRYFILSSFLISILPFFHAHGLILMAISLPAIALIESISANRHRLRKTIFMWVTLGIVVCVFTIPQLMFYSHSGESVRFQLGWLTSGGRDNFIWFWIKNTGLLIPAAFAALCFLNRHEKINILKFYMPFLLVFIVANIIIFQPYEYTNSKLLYHWYFFTAPLVALTIVSLLRKNILLKIAGLFLFISITLSGFLDVLRVSNYSKNKMLLFDKQSILLSDFVKKATNPHSVFITSSQHNHPITALAGRTTLLGYQGWLWTFAIQYSQRESDLQQIYSGTYLTKGLLAKYNVNYLAIGPSEIRQYPVNKNFFDENYPLVYSDSYYFIYEISKSNFK